MTRPSSVRRLLYLVALGIVGYVLYRQGTAPWEAACNHWPAFLAAALIVPAGLWCQGAGFTSCLPSRAKRIDSISVIRIWAASAVTAFVAPLVAGLAIRAGLLRQAGLAMPDIARATVVQTWLNVRAAFVVAALILISDPWPRIPHLGWAMLLLAALFVLTNRLTPVLLKHSFLFRRMHSATDAPSHGAHLWAWGQLAFMAINYFAAFNLCGAELSIARSLLFAALTILASLAIFIPNGVGVLDGVWVWAAKTHGMTTSEGIAVAIILRFGALAGASLTWGLLKLLTTPEDKASHAIDE